MSSTTFILMTFLAEIIWSFQIWFKVVIFLNSKFELKKITTLNQILKLQMISAKKVMKIKVVELIKIYNFYFGHLFIRQSYSNLIHKFYVSLLQFMRYVKFVNYVTITLSDEQMTKIKVIDLDELCNFYVHDFFI